MPKEKAAQQYDAELLSESDDDHTGEDTIVEKTGMDAETLKSILHSLKELSTTVQDLKNHTMESQKDIEKLNTKINLVNESNVIVPTATAGNANANMGNHSQTVRDVSPPLSFGTSQTISASTSYPPPATVKLHDLPTFSGNVEEWPLFLANYQDSTEDFKYSNRQNLQRLQKCLVGPAREAVASMLINVQSVPDAIDELNFRFGRPDVLVRHQLQKIQKFPVMTENKVDQLLVFSTQVRNVVAFLRSSNSEHNLNNSTILDELVSKLPQDKQYEWAKHSTTIVSYPTIADFSKWLCQLARIVCLMPPPPPPARNIASSRQQPLPHTRRVLYVNDNTEAAQQDAHATPKCYQCGENHFISKCNVFNQSMSVEDRWQKVKTHHLCFSCLRKGHSTANCRSKRLCGVQNCRRYHHSSLHDVSPRNITSIQPVLSCRTTQSMGLLFKIIPVTLFGPNGKLDVFAMFDEGSAISIVEEEVSSKLGLKGRSQPLTLQWYGQNITTEPSTAVNIEIRGEGESASFVITNCRTVRNLNLPVQTFNKSEFKHFEYLPLRSYKNVQPMLLIGLDNVYLGTSSTIVQSGDKKPLAMKTKLGWVAYGPSNSNVAASAPAVLTIRERHPDDDLHTLIKEYFSADNFGVNPSPSILESDDNQRARQIMQDTTCRIGNRFETGLLWKDPKPILPNSLEMAKKRLIGVEKKMIANRDFAKRYIDEMNKYIDKGYARKLKQHEIEDEYHQPVWYLPHFAVQSPHKPEKLRIVFDAAAAVNGVSLNSALLKGPEQAKPLMSILFKFREGIIGVAADIREMFSQIRIRSNDQHSQRFLWRDGDATQPISHYAMVSMIFGSICSPCVAEFIKNLNAQETDVVFVFGKTRGAPQKTMSIPRLELQAAVLGIRLSKAIVRNHDINIAEITYWTDSRTLLYWITSTERKFKSFVAHRIAEILSQSKPSQWRWTPTVKNSADVATRAKGYPKLNVNSVWLSGPDFLKQKNEYWPAMTIKPPPNNADLEEVKPCLFLQLTKGNSLINFNRFSSYPKLKRTMAYVLRAISKFRCLGKVQSFMPRTSYFLTVDEINEAENHLCKIVQQEQYHDEIKTLLSSLPIARKSSIYSLNPYLDENGLLRVQGRLDEALYLPFQARRPILLPQKHKMSELIMSHYHKKLHHQNSAVILNEARQKFWFPHAKSLLKLVRRKCQECKFDRAKPMPPLMGQLPIDRITPYIRPFTYTGVDLFGPLNVTIGRRQEKRWGVIFTCLTIRAAHLELAENLSTDAFILCLRNFINRRGTPVKIRSDNGTNFIGAQRELKDEQRLFDVDRIREEATSRNIKWVFNCPSNPSSGGCWERLIRIIKRLMMKTLSQEAPKVETLRSVLIEAENIINSRPLTDIPIAMEEDDPLTPNHFLLGCVNSTQTPNPVDEKICLRKQWRIALNLKDRLWKKWITEYLPQLLKRPKWHDKVRPLQINDIVIICDSNQPRSQWRKGRITKVFPAKDGQIRLAEVKTSNGLIRRPASRLAVLNIDGESQSDSRGEEC